MADIIGRLKCLKGSLELGELYHFEQKFCKTMEKVTSRHIKISTLNFWIKSFQTFSNFPLFPVWCLALVQSELVSTQIPSRISWARTSTVGVFHTRDFSGTTAKSAPTQNVSRRTKPQQWAFFLMALPAPWPTTKMANVLVWHFVVWTKSETPSIQLCVQRRPKRRWPCARHDGISSICRTDVAQSSSKNSNRKKTYRHSDCHIELRITCKWR